MREDLLKKLAKSYYKLLVSIDWEDQILINGLREGLNKFLSNAYLNSFKANKYHKCDFYSESALDVLNNGKQSRNLVFEHVVPKSQYIQKPCEDKAKKGILTLDFVEELVLKYWVIAVITKEEDELLSKYQMPDTWDGTNILARYEKANIKLTPNEKLYRNRKLASH